MLFQKILKNEGVDGDCAINAMSVYFRRSYTRMWRYANKVIPNSQFFLGTIEDSGITFEEFLTMLSKKGKRFTIWAAVGNTQTWKLSEFSNKMFVICGAPNRKDGEPAHVTVFKRGSLYDRDVKFLGYNVYYVVTIGRRNFGSKWLSIFRRID
jgi:hypothetical protein